jgi:sulfatase maturation enzyme AslB (radical SAM superfamily)
MASAPKFRIDVDIHNLLMDSSRQVVKPAAAKGLTLPEPVFPQYPEKLADPGPEIAPEKRDWSLSYAYRAMRGWLFPYIRSRVLPGEFHPITAYLFVEYKCNLDCWYCWAYNNKVTGMTEDVARRSIDWLYDHGCRVLALMGGEPLLRPQFANKVVYYAAKKDSGSTSVPMAGCYAPMWLTVWEMQARQSLTSPSIPGTRSRVCRRPSYPCAST